MKQQRLRWMRLDNAAKIYPRKLTKLLGKASRGRCGKGKAEQLKAAAAESFGVSFATEAFAFQIRQLIEQLEFLEGQIAELEEQISILLKRTGVSNLQLLTISSISLRPWSHLSTSNLSLL